MTQATRDSDRFIAQVKDTLDFVTGICGSPVVAAGVVATAMVAMCVQHPEWAAAWYRTFERDGAPMETLDDFVRRLPISAVTEVPRG